jgi:hypothetical protein
MERDGSSARIERRADPRTGIVWTLDREDGSVVHLITRSPSRHTTRSYATWKCWEHVTNPQVARVAHKKMGA